MNITKQKLSSIEKELIRWGKLSSIACKGCRYRTEFFEEPQSVCYSCGINKNSKQPNPMESKHH